MSTKKKKKSPTILPAGDSHYQYFSTFLSAYSLLIHLGVALIIRVKVVTKIPGNFAFKHWKIVSCVENPGFTQELVCGGKANCPFLFFPVPFQGGR